MHEYKIISSAIDFGKTDDGKDWTGLRLFVQELRKDKKGSVVGMLSKVYKAVDSCIINYDSECCLFFDERGRVAYIQYNGSSSK